MTILKSFLTVILLSVMTTGYSQLNAQLCNPDETVVFSFQLKNQKWVSVCKGKKDKYIVYRFGTKDNVELQYPANPGADSWQQFSINGYDRGGGKANAAMRFAYLSFTNNNILYEVYDTWSSEDNKQQCGVNVIADGKTTDMRGVLATRKGDLLPLWFDGKMKKADQ